MSSNLAAVAQALSVDETVIANISLDSSTLLKGDSEHSDKGEEVLYSFIRRRSQVTFIALRDYSSSFNCLLIV